jgi:hypothetical protein
VPGQVSGNQRADFRIIFNKYDGVHIIHFDYKVPTYTAPVFPSINLF